MNETPKNLPGPAGQQPRPAAAASGPGRGRGPGRSARTPRTPVKEGPGPGTVDELALLVLWVLVAYGADSDHGAAVHLVLDDLGRYVPLDACEKAYRQWAAAKPGEAEKFTTEEQQLGHGLCILTAVILSKLATDGVAEKVRRGRKLFVRLHPRRGRKWCDIDGRINNAFESAGQTCRALLGDGDFHTARELRARAKSALGEWGELASEAMAAFVVDGLGDEEGVEDTWFGEERAFRLSEGPEDPSPFAEAD